MPSSDVHDFANAPVHADEYNQDMDEQAPPNYLKAWRKKRGFTQEQLADAIGTTKSQISELERGNLQLGQKWLLKISPVLEVRVGYLLEVDPEALDSDILDMWAQIPVSERGNAAKALQGFIRTGTDD